MAGPSLNEVHTLRLVNNFQIAYMGEIAAGFSAACPQIPSQFNSDIYAILKREYFMRAQGAPRAPNTRATRLDMHIDYGRFHCEDIEAEYLLDDKIRANYDSNLNADIAGTRVVTRSLMLSKELMAHRKFMQTGVWSLDYQPNVDGDGYWDSDNSQPIKQIRALRREIVGSTMVDCNTLFLSQDLADAAMDNQSIIYRIVFKDGGFVDEATLAKAFGVERVIILKTSLDQANDPRKFQPGFLSSGQFLLCYVSPSASTQEATAMAQFNWTGYTNAGPQGNLIERYRDEPNKSDAYRGRFSCDFVVTAPDLGIFGYNCLAPKGTSTGSTTPTMEQATSPQGPTASSGTSSSSGSTSSSTGDSSSSSTTQGA